MLYQEAERLFVAEAKVERLEAQAAALRETLEAVEWGPQGYCAFCGNHQDDGHRPDCLRQITLAADAGRAFSERLRRAERERDEVRIDLEGHKKANAQLKEDLRLESAACKTLRIRLEEWRRSDEIHLFLQR